MSSSYSDLGESLQAHPAPWGVQSVSTVAYCIDPPLRFLGIYQQVGLVWLQPGDCFGWQVYEGVIFYNFEIEKIVEEVCAANQFG